MLLHEVEYLRQVDLSNLYVVIMAGGVGSRFWPLSREAHPKQFLDVLGTGQSLIQSTFHRYSKIVAADRILVVTNESYVEQVADHLPEIPSANILAEPARRNTAPCIAFAMSVIESRNPKGVAVIAAADHHIKDEVGFVNVIQQAAEIASKQDVLMTIGIEPTRPATGYGYIHQGDKQGAAFQVKAFCEKPNFELAQQFIQSGEYLWNAGIFVWSLQSIKQAYNTFAKQIFNTAWHPSIADSSYELAESTSVDFAIMERAKNVLTVPANVGWSDVGSWSAVHELSKLDQDKNAKIGNIHTVDSHGCYLNIQTDKKVVIYGMNDMVVIDQDDVLLIIPKKDENRIKETLKELKASGKTKLL